MGVEEFKNLLREVKIMSHVGSHECIVSFTGASTRSIKKRKLIIVNSLINLRQMSCKHRNLQQVKFSLSWNTVPSEIY